MSPPDRSGTVIAAVSYMTALSDVLLINHQDAECVDPAYCDTNAFAVNVGCLLNVKLVVGSSLTVIPVDASTNSDSFTVIVAEFDVTDIALALDNTQRYSLFNVGNGCVTVVYDADVAPFIFAQFPPLSVDFCHW